mmetsp:Transcript_9828/g.16157  ORF Transcript_9828/g.16157 Transcript_9828/m.16157 type:complete len:144 (-) Transcript_9828:1176-1607(-)
MHTCHSDDRRLTMYLENFTKSVMNDPITRTGAATRHAHLKLQKHILQIDIIPGQIDRIPNVYCSKKQRPNHLSMCMHLWAYAETADCGRIANSSSSSSEPPASENASSSLPPPSPLLALALSIIALRFLGTRLVTFFLFSGCA